MFCTPRSFNLTSLNGKSTHGDTLFAMDELKDWMDDDNDEILAFEMLFADIFTGRDISSLMPAPTPTYKRSANVNRSRQLYAERLENDYWGPNPTYNEKAFWRRFRMRRTLFDAFL